MIDNNIAKVLMSAHQARSFEQTQFCGAACTLGSGLLRSAVGACG